MPTNTSSVGDWFDFFFKCWYLNNDIIIIEGVSLFVKNILLLLNINLMLFMNIFIVDDWHLSYLNVYFNKPRILHNFS